MLGWISIVRIFLRTEERHIFTEKQIYHNKIKYSANTHSTSKKNMLCEVKYMFIKLHCLVSGGFIADSRFGNGVWSKLDA